jgi:Protein of unknown function (DUF3306)
VLSRWSRLKSESKKPVIDAPLQQEPSLQPVVPDSALAMPDDPLIKELDGQQKSAEPANELKALPEIADLTNDSDYTPFMQNGVDPAKRNAAMRKLFTDPHYNVMDGLDIYIDDYGKPDPIPPEMLRNLMQSKMLNLFNDEPELKEDDSKQSLSERDDATPPEPLDNAPRENPSSRQDIDKS